MKKLLPFLFFIQLAFVLPSSNQTIEVSAALRDETRTITTTNLSDTAIHQYYDDWVTEGMSGSTLKTALNNRIKDHTVITPYAETKYAMAVVDRDYTKSPLASGTSYDFSNVVNENPYMRLMYGKYNGTSNAFRWNDNPLTIWNKEHTWPKSLGNFGETAPAGTDLHHLIAADQNNNNLHSNLDYGEVVSGATNVLDERNNISGKTGYSALSLTKKVYEPADEYKGDIARMIFYMATRYTTYSSVGNPKLRIVENVVGGTTVTSNADTFGEVGILSDYLAWNEADPVDDYEIKRNNLIYHNFQGNRNPYIDHPEWAEIVFDASYSGPGATIASETSSVGTNPAWYGASSLSLTSISVNIANVKTDYALNEPFLSDGLIVTATMSDNSTKVVNGWITNYDGVNSFSSSGTKTVTVSYTEAGTTVTTTYPINVANKTLTALELNTDNVPLFVSFKDTYTHDDVIVTARYSDNSTLLLSNDIYQTTTINTNELGNQMVTVSYAGITANYSIKVSFQNANLNFAEDLFISEYMEGSSNNKYIEIYNGTGENVNLDDYSLRVYFNENTTSYSNEPLDGELPSGQTYLLANSSANVSIKTKVDAHPYKEYSEVITFNGNDTVALVKNDDIIDKIGVIGGNVNWSITDINNTSVSTVNRGLIRTSSVYKGNPTFTWTGATTEWRGIASDDDANLGIHTFTNGDLVTPSLVYANFFLDVTAPYCATLDGGNVPWIDLSSEYAYLSNGMKDYFTSTNESTIVSARLRYEFLVNKYPTLNANNFLVNGSNTPLYRIRIPGLTSSNAIDGKFLSFLFGGLLIQTTLIIKRRKKKFD